MFIYHVPVTTCRIFERLSTVVFALVRCLAGANSKVSALDWESRGRPTVHACEYREKSSVGSSFGKHHT